jgi:hypothetical protein
VKKFAFLLSLFSLGCTNRDLLLKKVGSVTHYTIDTLEQYPERDIEIVNLIDEGAMGHFSVHPAVIKRVNGSVELIYELERGGNQWIRLSKDYVALVRSNAALNQGWFLIKNGTITDRLPGMESFLDSLKANRPKDISVKEMNGYVSVLKDGKKMEELNYGNMLSNKLKKVNFGSLRYGLYMLVGDSLIRISEETNDIRVQKDGLFFVPPPGYDVIEKYRKSTILEIIDSVTKLSPIPDKIFVKPT